MFVRFLLELHLLLFTRHDQITNFCDWSRKIIFHATVAMVTKGTYNFTVTMATVAKKRIRSIPLMKLKVIEIMPPNINSK